MRLSPILEQDVGRNYAPRSSYHLKIVLSNHHFAPCTNCHHMTTGHLLAGQGLGWIPGECKNSALNVAILIATGHTLLGLVLVARDTNILSCVVWSRGRVSNSCS